MYMTLIRPVILYESEIWALRKMEEIRLGTFERKVLRRIFGLCLDSKFEEWRIRTNEELLNMFQRPSTSRKVAKRRLMWAGHIWSKKDAMINAVIKKNRKEKYY
jgi:hypothetical protein